jgi:hypothetical protein
MKNFLFAGADRRRGPGDLLKSAPLALLLLAWAFAATAQDQPTTLTLACKGTLARGDREEPVSMSIFVNFSAKTVQFDGSDTAKITAADDLTITLGAVGQYVSITGSMDRVTGDVWAVFQEYDEKKILGSWAYQLQCKPAQRMF